MGSRDVSSSPDHVSDAPCPWPEHCYYTGKLGQGHWHTKIGGAWTSAYNPPGAQVRHPLSARLHSLLEELGELHDKKQADYGRAGDPFANVRASSEWGVRPWVGAMIRLNDKVKRLQSFSIKGSLTNESAIDSFKDIAVYALIALVLYEEETRDGVSVGKS